MADKKDGQLPEFFFDNRSGCYWLAIQPGRFVSLDARNMKLHMRLHEFEADKENDFGLKAGDKALLLAQRHRFVDFAGPLAGHAPGILKLKTGQRVLVTTGVSPVAAARGPTDKVDSFLGELLGDQVTHLLCWLKVARQSLLDGDFRPGQMLCLAGPSGCGKSLLQSLITEFLGGRAAKPYRYMTGQTSFNSDLASAEHLIIADEQASVDIRSRRNFGAAIKDLIVNLEMSLHAKGKDAVTLPTFKRLSLSVNDEPENLMILPPLDESILDKLMLLKCAVANVGSNRKRIWSGLTGELAALAYDLERMQIPVKLRDNRYGVAAYHNPELFEMISDISPEQRLLTLIDEVIKFPFDGSAEEMERSLRNSPFCFAVEKLLSFPSAAGTYLARLARKFPDRFSSVKNAGKTRWSIYASK